MSINTAIQYTEQYIQQIDPSGTLDPFNFYDAVAMHWTNESASVHEEFIRIIKDTFGTTAYIKVGTALHQFLVPIAEDRIKRLIELSAPESIIKSAEKYADSLKSNDASPHILIAMLVVSIYKM